MSAVERHCDLVVVGSGAGGLAAARRLRASIEIPHAVRMKSAGPEAWAREMLACSRRALTEP